MHPYYPCSVKEGPAEKEGEEKKDDYHKVEISVRVGSVLEETDFIGEAHRNAVGNEPTITNTKLAGNDAKRVSYTITSDNGQTMRLIQIFCTKDSMY